MKNSAHILGLDLGTNSVGWALLNANQFRIAGNGSRIIPMTGDVMTDFAKGKLQSAASQRTAFRNVRKNIERVKQRRYRLLQVLHILGFLPQHFSQQIDFVNHRGHFIDEAEPLLPYRCDASGRHTFIFEESFREMLADFAIHQPQLVADGRKVPHDWTLFYLRKKALTQPVSREELAWIILNFNAKRGYYQLRGMGESEEKDDGTVFARIQVAAVEAMGPSKRRRGQTIYCIRFDNGCELNRESECPPFAVGDQVDVLCTTKTDKNGQPKLNEQGKPQVVVSIPDADDWTFRKKKSECDIELSQCTVGAYIYNHLLAEPDDKIRGHYIHTIERKFYRSELEQILHKQQEFIPELTDKDLLQKCALALYTTPERAAQHITKGGLTDFIVRDILFYQRPLKSQKKLIANCPYERYRHVDYATGELVEHRIKCVPKSHPLFQEFRLWQFISQLRIYQREAQVGERLVPDYDVTDSLLPDAESRAQLFDHLFAKKEFSQKDLLGFKPFKLSVEQRKGFRWNYPEEKTYPANRTLMSIPKEYRDCFDEKLWHLLYSVTDPEEIVKALNRFARERGIPDADAFVEALRKVVFTETGYGAYSLKALKHLLPLMRCGHHWKSDAFDAFTLHRLELLQTEPNSFSETARKQCAGITGVAVCQGLPLHKACYLLYGRYAESDDLTVWHKPEDIDYYLRHVFKQHSLRNPVVEGVVTETLRVVRDIWKTYGRIDEIHIEMGRDLKQNSEERKQTFDRNSENERANYRARRLLQEFAKPEFDVENVRPYSPLQLEVFSIFESTILNDAANSEEKLQYKDVINDLGLASKADKVSHSDILRYRLWLEQKYRSPYTGMFIPLSKLFTPAYEVEHVLPKARYYDDSMRNKVICEKEVNKLKDKMTGYEFIIRRGGEVVKGAFGQTFTLLTREAYEAFVKTHYAKLPGKMKILLMEDIPQEFNNRMLNDTRYISRLIMTLLSKVVGEEGEEGAKSKHIINTNGRMTSELKRQWGLNEVWNHLITPRFERLNQRLNTTEFGEMREVDGKRFFQTQVPLHLPPVNRKRIDHRHHALDAIVIACTTLNHVTYFNSVAAKDEVQGARYDLRRLLCEKTRTDDCGNYTWTFKKPWETFTHDVELALDNMVVSFKHAERVFARTKDGHITIRKPLHKETYYGRVKLPWAKDEYQVAVRKELDESFNAKKIQSITDTGIQSILLRHLANNGGDPKVAFSVEGKVRLQQQLKELNLGKPHKPIYKVRVSESLGMKFAVVGKRGCRKAQFVETGKGTNLFFAVYQKPNGNRIFQTISLREAVVNLVELHQPAAETLADGSKLLFVISPNDLVYVPAMGEVPVIDRLDSKRIFKMVSCYDDRCSFLPQSVASFIYPKVEYLSHNIIENTDDGISIKKYCLKLEVDRLGQITNIIGL